MKVNGVQQREGWVLSCPAPVTGVLAAGAYNAGPGLAEDIETTTAEDSYMQVVTGQEVSGYTAYLERLAQAGYTKVLENRLGQNLYSSFVKGTSILHVSYVAVTKELRVVEDHCSTPLGDFSYSETGTEQTTIYQYGLYYDPQNRDNTGKTINCGMMYVVKLSDNSLLMIDGGHIYQCSDEAIQGLWNFLHEITNTPFGEKIRVAAWYFTHAHGDHVTGCTKLLHRHHDEIDLQRVMYNFPSYQVRPGGYDHYTTGMKAMIRECYPNVPFLKLHTGQKFSLSDVIVEVLYTHEDAVWAEDLSVFPLGDYNCTSAVLKLTVNGKNAIFLGDTNLEAEAVVAKLSAPSVWKGDLVQVAHHCFNYLNTLYQWISAPVALLPNSYFGAHTPENTPKLQSILQYVKDEQIYYEGEGTYGFGAEDKGFVCVYQAPVIGTEYDDSGI